MAAEQAILMPVNDEKQLAVLAESLYLANLLLTPAIAFFWLLWLYRKRRNTASPLALCHLRQTLVASIWAGVLLLPFTVLTIAVGGYQSIGAWTVAILYFTVCHASLVLMGIVGLAKAMAGQPWRYPLIGPVSGGQR
jgi:uncharacterized Tic20 family protein